MPDNGENCWKCSQKMSKTDRYMVCQCCSLPSSKNGDGLVCCTNCVYKIEKEFRKVIMATWKGNPKKFEVEYLPKDFAKYQLEPQWGDLEFRWEYQTTSDILTIYAEHPDMETQSELIGPDWAKAKLYMLADYYKTYVGGEQLKELLKDILEE